MALLTLASLALPSWQEFEALYARFDGEVSPHIARRQYSVGSAGLERPEPFWLERDGRQPAALVDHAPQDLCGVVCYSLTAFDRVPMLSQVHDGDGEIAVAWLRWMINRTDFRLRFSLAVSPPKLTEVVAIWHSLAEQLTETISFTDEGRTVHRESYQYDAAERVSLIEVTDGTPTEITARSVIEVSYGAAAPTFAERPLGIDERFPVARAPVDTMPAALPPEAPPEAVARAAEETVASLSAAAAAWYERLPQSSSVTRLFLLHDWPVNPPFPPALVACRGSWSTGDDPYEFFEPDSETDAWSDPGVFRNAEVESNAEVLNTWFMATELERSPFDLLVEIARATRQEIAERTGRDVRVLPIDYDLSEVDRAVTALLPPDEAAPILAALRAAEEDA